MADSDKNKTANKDRAKKVYAEKGETKSPKMTEKEIRAAALAYAVYLKENGLEPGDATFVDPESLGVSMEGSKSQPARKASPAQPAQKVRTAQPGRKPAQSQDRPAQKRPAKPKAPRPRTAQEIQEAEIEAKLTMLQIDSAEEIAKLEPSNKKVFTTQKIDHEAERRKQASQAKREEQARRRERAQRKEQQDREKELRRREAENRAAAERAERERLAAERARKERAAAARAEKERAAAEKAQRERAAAERAEAERAAAERAQMERIAAERAEAERAAAAKAEAERAAAAKAEAERAAAAKAEAERAAAARAQMEKAAAEKAQRERIAAERAKAERAAALKAEKERAAAEKAEKKRAAAEKAEKERAAAAKAREKKKQQARKEAERRKARRNSLKTGGRKDPLAVLVEMHDKAQDRTDEALSGIGKDFAKETHRITSSYKLSRRTIGLTILVITLLASAILIVFDRFTVYEYAYNGKVLGYVKDQEEVTDILDVAGEKLSQNLNSETGVKFVANQNITFNEVDSRGKSTDDADIAVNKLIYMTDIETEAYGIYDGDRIVAIVKDSQEAEDLLNETKDELSRPDNGMTLVSSEFTNPLDIKPINVLLSSVQSSAAARKQMIEGGEMETFHIVEEGETLESLAKEFGVETLNIFDEDNKEPAEEVEQGDKVCIRSSVEPVNVKMVETGKMKETIEYKTIKKESDEYYKGDSFVEQKGKNGTQIFEGTITKVAGEVTDRKEDNIEIIEEKKDKIILVGTKERPKTAPTGTFAMPIKTYTVTSEFGGRWGRQHTGIDLGAGTGTPIYAADGGKVIRAGWYSGYGLCVDIDHEHGKITRYGHCSKLLVSAGDLVYQGQEIALVGNTGHSFGSHLHFEVRINGTPQNPRNYINP